MYAQIGAHSGYDTSLAALRSDRSTEANLIAGVTRRMVQASRPDHGCFPDLAAALSDNRRMWARFAADVAHQDNGLTPQLRGQIFYLGEFVAQHTTKVLQGEAEAAPLIEINTAVMRGLSGNPGQPGAAA